MSPGSVRDDCGRGAVPGVERELRGDDDLGAIESAEGGAQLAAEERREVVPAGVRGRLDVDVGGVRGVEGGPELGTDGPMPEGGSAPTRGVPSALREGELELRHARGASDLRHRLGEGLEVRSREGRLLLEVRDEHDVAVGKGADQRFLVKGLPAERRVVARLRERRRKRQGQQREERTHRK